MLFRKIGLAALLLFFSSYSFAEEFVVKDIRVNGLQKISIDAVLQNLIVKPEDSFDTKQSHKLLEELFATGFFKKIDLERNGDTLVVNVVEYPSIGELIVKGVKKNEKIKKILVDNNIEEGRIFNKNNLKKVENDLKYHYFNQKRYGVKVDSDISELSKNRVRIVLDIYEGDVAKLKEIKLIGNDSFSSREILKHLNHQPTNFFLSWFTKSDQYSKEKLEADLEIIRSFYLNKGYVNFRIESTQVSLTPDKKSVHITISVKEGDKHFLNNVKVAGNVPIEKERVDTILSMLPKGSVFSRKNIIDAQNSLETALGEYGYSFAKVRVGYDNVTDDKKLDLTFYIDNLKKVLVRRINIVGNSLTQDEVVRREIAQMEATTINTLKVKNSKERIQRLGFASSIDIKTKNVLGTSDQVDLNYELQEQKFNSFTAELGFNMKDKFIFKLGTDLKNVVGTGKDVNVHFERTRVNQNYRASYFDPYFTLDGIGFGGNLAYERANLSKSTDIADYSTGKSLADVHWVLPISGLERLNIKFGFEQTSLSIKGQSEEATAFTQMYGMNYKNFFTQIGWTHNSLNKFLFPTKGFSHGFDVKITSPWDRLRYYTVSYYAKWYYPLEIREKYLFSIALNLGFGDGFGGDLKDKQGNTIAKRLPFFKNYFAGGTDTVRGFAENSLGPKDSKGKVLGGNFVTSGSVALIFPNPLAPDVDEIRTSVFVDFGQVYNTKGKVSDAENTGNSCMRYSVGAALTWNSPLGAPLTFSFAQPLNRKEGDKVQVGQFAFNARF